MTKLKKTKIKLGAVIMDALIDEDINRTADITDKPVEKGQDIADHMKPKGHVLRLSGSMVDDAPKKLNLLKNYQKKAELLKFQGRNIYENVVITSLDTRHTVANSKGFDYSITLEQVRIAKPETFVVNVKNPDTGKQDPKTATKVKEKTNAGRKQLGGK